MMNFLKIISLCILIFSCSSDSTDTPKVVENKIQPDMLIPEGEVGRHNLPTMWQNPNVTQD